MAENDGTTPAQPAPAPETPPAADAPPDDPSEQSLFDIISNMTPDEPAADQAQEPPTEAQEAAQEPPQLADEPAAAPEQGQEPEPPEPPQGRSAEAVAARERAVWQKEQDVRAQQHRLQALDRFEELKAKDPVAAMRAIGIDPQLAGQAFLEGEPPKPGVEQTVAQLQQKIQQMEQQAREQAEQAQIEAIRSNHLQDIRTRITSGESYPILKAMEEEGSPIADRIIQEEINEYRQFGTAPDREKVLARMEKEHADNVFASFSALTKVPSIMQRLRTLLQEQPAAPAGQTPQTPPAPQQQAAQPPGKTLTNDMTGPSTEDVRQMSDEEADAEAWKWFHKAVVD